MVPIKIPKGAVIVGLRGTKTGAGKAGTITDPKGDDTKTGPADDPKIKIVQDDDPKIKIVEDEPPVVPPEEVDRTPLGQAIASMGEGSALSAVTAREVDARKKAEALAAKREKRKSFLASRGAIKLPPVEVKAPDSGLMRSAFGVDIIGDDPGEGSSVFAGKGLTPEKIEIGLANIEGKLIAPKARIATLDNEINESQKYLDNMAAIIEWTTAAKKAGREGGSRNPKPGQRHIDDYHTLAYGVRGQARPGDVKSFPKDQQILHAAYQTGRTAPLSGEPQEGTALDLPTLVEDHNKLRAAIADKTAQRDVFTRRRQELEAAALNLKTSRAVGTDFQPPKP